MRQPGGDSSTFLRAQRSSTRVEIASRANDTAHAGHSRWQELAVISVVMSLTVYLFARTVADPDLWGHIKFGETIWNAGTVAVPDPFSYLTSGRLWLNHEWLSEVVFYLVFRAIGPAGLIAMKVVLGLVVTGILYRHLCLQGVNALRAAFLVVVVLFFFLISLVTVRTLIFTYPLFLITLVLIHRMSTSLPRWRWIVPPLFVLWANLHPGFIAGLGILGIWASVEILARHLTDVRSVAARPATREIVLLMITGGLATLLNPYGLTLWAFLRETAFGARPDISEWQPLVLMTSYGLSYAAFVGVALWGIIYSRRPRRASLMAVLTVTALLPLMAIRHTPLAALGVTALAGEHIADAWDRWSSARHAPGPLRHLSPAWFAAAALAAALILGASSLPRFSCIRITPKVGGSYPARAVGLIKQSGVVGNMAIDFDWGEYALYHLSPAVKVSVDGRRETIYSPAIYIENLTFMFGQRNWDALLQRPETHLALVKTGFPTFNLMKLKPDWRLIYEDPLASIFGREGLPIVEILRRTVPPPLPPDGAGLCFP
jgi:hypothetical protein